MDNQPLAGVRILDLSRILAGPWCSQHLADLGADVIKIEDPRQGDDTRRWGPPWHDETGEAAYYLSANRGKRSVTLDFTQAEGQRLVRELVQQSDVVLENFKVGGLAKYGLDYPSLSALKPELIYCSITGFGQDGPYAKRAGYDFMIQGMGGLMSITGLPDGEPGAGPVKVGVAVVDLFTGMYAATAILAALWQRQRTGRGSHIDVALLDVEVAMLANQALNYLTSRTTPSRLGNAHPNIVPYQAFATADGHLILAVGNDKQFQRFCEVAGEPELAKDNRFSSNPQRVAHRAELNTQLNTIFIQKSTQHWLSALAAVGVPCGPINRIDQVFADPQVQYRGMQLTLADAQHAAINLVGNPLRFDGQPLNASVPPPGHGQHTQQVLQELLSCSSEDLALLQKQGVIK